MRPCPLILPAPAPRGHNPEADGLELAASAPLVTDLNLEDLEHEARRAIGEMAYAYYAGGADDERLLEGNVAAWAHWQLHPRVLAGINEVSTATTVLGTPVSSPVAVAPTAIQGLAHAEGEVATARGAAAAGALLILSSLATCPLEDVAAAAPEGARWMQVYILRERARTAELVSRAAAHGYRALVLTVDAPVSGLRLREWRLGVHLPDDLALPNLAGDSTSSAREGGFMAVVDAGVRAGADARRHRVAGRAQLAARRREGCAAGGRRAALCGGGGGGGGRVEPWGPAAGRRAGDGRHPVRGRRHGGWAGRGVRRRRRAPLARRGQGAGFGGAGGAGRAPVAVGPGHRRGGRRGRAAALVRVRAAPGHGAVRGGECGRDRPGAGAPGARGGACRDDGGRHAGGTGRGRPHGRAGRQRHLDLA